MLKLIALVTFVLTVYFIASAWLANSVVATCAQSAIAIYCK